MTAEKLLAASTTQKDGFHIAIRELVEAVSALTCRVDERAIGFVANSVSLLSLKPLSLIVCANRASMK